MVMVTAGCRCRGAFTSRENGKGRAREADGRWDEVFTCVKRNKYCYMFWGYSKN